jgi:hypothetical protein
VRVDGASAGADLDGVAPDLLQQLVLREDALRLAGELAQEREL